MKGHWKFQGEGSEKAIILKKVQSYGKLEIPEVGRGVQNKTAFSGIWYGYFYDHNVQQTTKQQTLLYISRFCFSFLPWLDAAVCHNGWQL